MSTLLKNTGFPITTGGRCAVRGVCVWARLRLFIYAAALLLVPTGIAGAQLSPVFVDDAPGAVEAIRSARGQAASGNVATAARIIQSLLTANAERLTSSQEDELLMVPVRDRAHELLRSDPELLEQYRRAESSEARRMLDAGLLDRVERERFLTSSGREAALRLAQKRMETARFESALRLLEAVDAHPDHRGADDGAAALATELARHLPAADALAQKWSGGDAERVEGPRIVRARDAFEAAPALAIDEVVSRPIRSRPFEDAEGEPSGMLGAGPVAARSRGGSRVQLDPARTVVPSQAGDLLLLCDGMSVRALDRFTLEERWRVDGATGGRRDGAPRLPMGAGPLTVGAWGGTAVAATVETLVRRMVGNGRVHGIDIDSGRRLWSVDISELHPDLSGAQATGAVVAGDGLAVVVASRRVREQRLDSTVLVALRLRDGTLAWRRTVASAGSLPQSRQAGAGAVPVIDRGVVYFVEPLGTTSAVELASGRILWSRLSRAVDRPTPNAQMMWPARPLVRDGALYVIEPGGARVLALDARDGRLLGERAQSELGLPGALLGAGEHLVGASENELYALRFADFGDESAEPSLVFTPESGWFEGRPVASGERVLAPHRDGFALVDPSGGGVVAEIDFGNTGNALVSEAQLAVLDRARVSSYLVWEAARDALQARMEASPGDAAPAVTLAELAHRAERYDAIVPAIDAALDALRRDARSRKAATTRARLFRSIDAMIEPSSSAGVAAGEDPVLAALIERLGQAASTPAESALYHVREGAFAEASRRAGDAVASYQRVLDDPAMRRSAVTLASRTVEARTECTRRLRRIVEAEGPEVYAVFAREASLALEREAASGDPDRLAEIARRYPVSVAALRAWVAASDAALARGKLRGSIGFLEEALAATDGVPGAGDEIVGEIVGRLATRLVEGERAAAASAVLARAAQTRPGLVLTDHGELVDVAGLQERIAQTRTRVARRPEIGALADTGMTTISERLAMRPLFAALDSDHSMVLLAGGDVLEAWEPEPEGGLRRRWSAPLDPAMALLRLDSVGAVVSLGFDDNRRLARINGRTGETTWEAPSFAESFPAGTTPGAGETVPLPGGSVRPRGEILVAMRDDAAALVERSGRVAGYDIAGERLLWARDVGVEHVYDAAESGGLLVVVGASRRDEAGARLKMQPRGVVLDLDSGREVAALALGEARARWVRATRDGVAVIGTDRGIHGFDLATGERLWDTSEAAARRTVEAWGFPGRVIVLDGGGSLWQLEVESGVMSRASLETRNRMDGDAALIEAVAAGDSAVLALPRGLVIYDRRGELVGVDHREALTTLGPAAFAENAAVTLEARGFEPRLYEARVIELATGRLLQSKLLELPARPHSLDLVDGRVIIGAGGGVVVVDAPLE